MAQTRLDQDVHINGTLTARAFTPPANCITAASIPVGAGIESTKTVHRHRKHYAISGTAASVTIPIHIAKAAGNVLSLEAGSIAIAVGSATVTINLLKNGSSILSGGTAITLDSSNVARTLEAATISSAAYVDGDFFELVIVATASGGTIPTGLIVDVEFDENPN